MHDMLRFLQTCFCYYKLYKKDLQIGSITQKLSDKNFILLIHLITDTITYYIIETFFVHSVGVAV